MWTLWTLLACGSDPKIGRIDYELEADPTAIDFGVVGLGQSAERSLTLRNDGTSDVLVTELRTSSTDLALIEVGSLQVPAGGEEALTIQWTPSSADALAGSIGMKVGALGELSDMEVPAVGTVTGVELTISAPKADLGEVSVGCSETLPIELRNTGTEELVIQSLDLTNDLEFTIEDEEGGAPVLPMKMAPGVSTVIDVVYTPTSEKPASTTLQIASNDALAPTQSVRVDGEGVIEASNTMVWTVEGHSVVTVILQVNDFLLGNDHHASTGIFADRVLAFVPALFEGLRDAGLLYRLAIVVDEDGEVAGDVPYIDDSFTVDEADAAAQTMLDTTSMYGDNDQGLETCLNAIEANESWLLADGDAWRDSRLNLLVINNDGEQSPGDVTYYLKRYSEYKDPEDFAVHGISGGPSGCTDGAGGSATASYGLYSAVEATGGVSLSICDADWTESVPALVESFIGGTLQFVLEGTPAPESIQVRIDGTQIFSGWSYDEKTHAIDFDAASFPPHGSELRVDYRMAVTCE
jgi:hypothetical protein